ncbi:MAG: ribosomal protein S18-alanine N-acetyltransferase [Candidatus Adiutrix sp.]|jgi:ribosomal-protein-alanine N-acetyltransferase|nr:ribosomal protein S18-alanine N-acetyltransferase [Candidatus Adiutrix sp.]
MSARVEENSRTPFELVRLTVLDLAAILELERSAYAQPWTDQNFLGEFQRPFTVAIGAKSGETLAAQCFFWLIASEAHLLNLTVALPFRRMGLARRLIAAMASLGRNARAEKIFLEVRPSNVAAVSLYKSAGFTAEGLRPGYYEDGEDALLMTLDITNWRPGPKNHDRYNFSRR